MLRAALFILAIVASVLLVVAEFLVLSEVQIITVTRARLDVGENHGYALAIIAVAAAVMAFGAFRGARPAAFALAALGVAALLVVLIADLPEVGREGLIGRDYEGAEAQAGTGFYLETAGAILLLATGVLTAALRGRPPAQGERTTAKLV